MKETMVWKKRIARKTILLQALLFWGLLFFLTGWKGTPAWAAEQTAKITECKLVSSGSVKISVRIENTAKVSGSKCYLFALPMGRDRLNGSDRPIGTRSKGSSLSFTVSLNKTKTSSRLYSRFAVAQKGSGGTYQIISNLTYLSNPQKAAKYTYRFPKATSKKGLQVSASMQEDAVELNVQHSVLNINFATLIASKGERKKSISYAYKYHGKTYWFRKYVVQDYDRQLKALKENNAVISAILLLSWRNDLKDLIYPDGRQQGHSYYAWNTKSASAREQLQAALSFLAERYSAQNGKYGRIVNWIVGNEVNNYKVYNYAGTKSLNQYAGIYAQAFRLTYQTVTSVYANARVYISLDHLWNTNTVNGTFAARKLLDAFAKQVGGDGSVKWNLAYHPYGSPLTEPRFWKNTNQQVTDSLTSPVINMANIGLLTAYVRENYGQNTRIILSEQGYTSRQKGRNEEKAQAAAIAYSYLLTEEDDMIDSFIMNRHVDHEVEVKQGLNLGLWTTSNPNSPEWASEKKYSWNMFKYMDSDQSPQVTSFALSEIGISSWNQVISDYGVATYQKYTAARGALRQVSSYRKQASLSQNWKGYGAISRSRKSKNAVKVIHSGYRNRNCLWGVSQSFSSPVSFSKTAGFYTTVKITGSTASKVTLKLRIFSGRNVFECEGKIPAGKQIRLEADLSKWKYRGKVTKIQVLAAPAGKGTWKSGASFEMGNSVRGRA